SAGPSACRRNDPPACGGFSYGDVLGAGEGWAKSILFNERVRDEFATFFHRPQTLALVETLFGIREKASGTITLHGKKINNHSANEAINHGFA
ncbi:phosphoribosylformylglycinamidine synthase subunit PurQ, partial [Klebsiella pneumoniae]|uniref:phosphoribosylformylglycinamidine synthase subunit PurQ n=1 Tax=Klebsiella pneumoniae TaxID=573 RepID=UPI00210AE19D